MYSALRYLIAALLFVIVALIIKKSKIANKKRIYIISGVSALGLAILLQFVTFEKHIISFSSAEDAYHYFIGDNYEIITVIDGENSALVVGEEGNTENLLIVPKSSDKWGVATGIDMQTLNNCNIGGANVSVYRYKNTNEFYVTVYVSKGGESSIKDSMSSVFSSTLYHVESSDTDYYTYYAYIPDADSDYWIEIDNEKGYPLDR